MRKTVSTLIIAGIVTAIWPMAIGLAAEVIIKVRALNPLNTKETAVINYPLPPEISEEDVLRQKITYSLDHSEDEEPPKAQFQISFDEETGGYFIDDEVVLQPKEIVTLEVHVQDVWVIPESQIEGLRREVDGLLETWETETQESSQTDPQEKSKEDENREFALMMKQEILDGLDEIIQRQQKSSILNVGVERHISAYEENMDNLRQIRQDIVLLTNLIQFSAEEAGEQDLEGENQLPDEEEMIPSKEPQVDGQDGMENEIPNNKFQNSNKLQ